MDRIDYLPLGSLVLVKGNVRKTLVIARGLATAIGGGVFYFDYGGCIYPEGLTGDQILYFNHKDIAKVIHEGYKDDDDSIMVDNINNWIEKSGLAYGDPYALNQQNSKLKALEKEEGGADVE